MRKSATSVARCDCCRSFSVCTPKTRDRRASARARAGPRRNPVALTVVTAAAVVRPETKLTMVAASERAARLANIALGTIHRTAVVSIQPKPPTSIQPWMQPPTTRCEPAAASARNSLTRLYVRLFHFKKHDTNKGTLRSLRSRIRQLGVRCVYRHIVSPPPSTAPYPSSSAFSPSSPVVHHS